MSHEDAAAKARRYLGEGRLTVTKVAGDSEQATCHGDGEVYRLGHEMARGWFCDCPVRADRCAHLAALRSVTVRGAAA